MTRLFRDVQLKKNIGDAVASVQEGFLWVVPCFLLHQTFLLVSYLPSWFPSFIAESCASSALVLSSALPWVISTAIGSVRAKQIELPRSPIALACGVFTILFGAILSNFTGLLQFSTIAFAILLGTLCPSLIKFLTKFVPPLKFNIGNAPLNDTMRLVLPIIATGITVVFFATFVGYALGDVRLDLTSFYAERSPYISGPILTLLNSLFWVMGIHGYLILEPIFASTSQINLELIAAGSLPNPLTTGFLGSYAFIGGSGGTLALIVCILTNTKSNSLRLLAMASIPLALFNVNELLLFGLPIIFGRRVFVPFLLAPVVGCLLALVCVDLEIIELTYREVPFNSPIGLNAFLTTDSWLGVVLQILIVGAGALIYLPFLKGLELDFPSLEKNPDVES